MQITSISKKPREFGPNQGIPTVHIEVGEGSEKIENLVLSVINVAGMSTRVFVGYKVVKGLSAFLTALNSVKFDLEVQILGNCQTPGWLNSPELVLANYVGNSSFNYYSLRKLDFILFDIDTSEQLEEAKLVFEEHKLTPATKWLLVPQDLYFEGYKLVTSYLRTRICIKGWIEYAFDTADNKVKVKASS